MASSTYYKCIDQYDYSKQIFADFEKVVTETDEAKRKELWAKILKTMHDEYSVIPLAGTKLNYISTPDLKGQAFYSQNAVDFRPFYFE